MASSMSPLLDKRYVVMSLVSQHPQVRRYAAQHVELDIPVRIAVFRAAGAGDPVDTAPFATFWKLAGSAARLRHPALARIRDCFQQGEYIAVVLDHVEGEPLRDRIARLQRLPLRETLAMGLQLCDLVTTIGDQAPMLLPLASISPRTLCVQPAGQVTLTDPGIGHWLEGPVPAEDAEALPYVAPEILARQPGTTGSDVYSIAAVMYHALAGEPPAPLGMGYTSLHALEPMIPSPLSDVIERALQPDPVLRYTTADAFGVALAEAMAWAMPGLVSRVLTTSNRLTSRAFAEMPVSDTRAQSRERGTSRALTAARILQWPHLLAVELSRGRVTEPLRKTGSRALAAISSALRLGA